MPGIAAPKHYFQRAMGAFEAIPHVINPGGNERVLHGVDKTIVDDIRAGKISQVLGNVSRSAASRRPVDGEDPKRVTRMHNRLFDSVFIKEDFGQFPGFTLVSPTGERVASSVCGQRAAQLTRARKKGLGIAPYWYSASQQAILQNEHLTKEGNLFKGEALDRELHIYFEASGKPILLKRGVHLKGAALVRAHTDLSVVSDIAEMVRTLSSLMAAGYGEGIDMMEDIGFSLALNQDNKAHMISHDVTAQTVDGTTAADVAVMFVERGARILKKPLKSIRFTLIGFNPDQSVRYPTQAEVEFVNVSEDGQGSDLLLQAVSYQYFVYQRPEQLPAQYEAAWDVKPAVGVVSLL